VKTEPLGKKALGPANALCMAEEVRVMTYIPNHVGMVSIEDARRILRAIFPDYPELTPCRPAPTLEPVTMSPMKTAL